MTEQMVEQPTPIPLPASASVFSGNPGTWTVRGEFWARINSDGTLDVDGRRVALPFDHLTSDQAYAVLMGLLAARRQRVSAQVADWWGDGDWRAPGD